MTWRTSYGLSASYLLLWVLCSWSWQKYFSSEKNKIVTGQRDISLCSGFSLPVSDSFLVLYLQEVYLFNFCITGSWCSLSRPASCWKFQHPFTTPKPTFTCLGLPSLAPAVGWILVCGGNHDTRCVIFSKPKHHNLRCSSPFHVLSHSWCLKSSEKL